MLKIAYNRFDVIKYYFDVMNNNTALDGTDVGIPFNNTSKNVIGVACPAERSVCGDETTNEHLTVTAKYIYRFHALRRMLAHAQNTALILISNNPSATGYGDMDVDAHPGDIETVETGIYDTSNLGHETYHRQGYSDKSGLTWWGGGDYNTQPSPLLNYIKNLDYYKDNITTEGKIDGSKKTIESSDYFADYLWISPTVVDVHFYAKNAEAKPLRNIAIAGGDEESSLDTPYTSDALVSSFSATDVKDGTTYQELDTDGNVTLDGKVQQINNNTLRIYLKESLKTNYNTIFVFASSANSNDEKGVWNTEFEQKSSDSIALQIQYDHEINHSDDTGNIAFVDNLDNLKDIIDNGNVAHIGRSSYSDITAPDYALSASLYKRYTINSAQERCENLGYKGLGKLPLSIGRELSETISKYVYGGVVVGYDFDNPDQIDVVHSVVNYSSGSSYHTKPTSFTTEIIDTQSADNITLLVCAKS